MLLANNPVLSSFQERIARAHGSQCGFCTPGFVMSMYTLLRNNTTPSEEEVEAAFEGRCVASFCADYGLSAWFGSVSCLD